MLDTTNSHPDLSELIVVGLGEIEVSFNIRAVLITYALGSRVGLTAYDPGVPVGGMLHFQLPRPIVKYSLKKPRFAYGCFAIPALLNRLYKMGAKKERLKVKLAGGAQKFSQNRLLRIGEQNVELAEEILREAGIPVAARDVGGTYGRNMSLRIKDGVTLITSPSLGDLEL